MNPVLRAAMEGALSAVAVIVTMFPQTADVPAATWLTGGAGVVGIIAIGQMVRTIGRTEAQKIELIQMLQEQLAASNEEIRRLYSIIDNRLAADTATKNPELGDPDE